MSQYIIGTPDVAFTCGITFCEERDAYLPFFAFAPSRQVEAELDTAKNGKLMSDDKEVRATYEIFKRHGTVIWVDHLTAAERVMGVMAIMLDRACETDWVQRCSRRETIQ